MLRRVLRDKLGEALSWEDKALAPYSNPRGSSDGSTAQCQVPTSAEGTSGVQRLMGPWCPGPLGLPEPAQPLGP